MGTRQVAQDQGRSLPRRQLTERSGQNEVLIGSNVRYGLDKSPGQPREHAPAGGESAEVELATGRPQASDGIPNVTGVSGPTEPRDPPGAPAGRCPRAYTGEIPSTKYQANTADTRYMRGWTSFHRPRRTWITV